MSDEDKRFERYLLDGGFWFEDYVEPVWAIIDTKNHKNPICFLEFKDEHKDLCDEIVEELNRLYDEKQNLQKCINEIYIISSRESVG